jgi:acetyl esterase/lipase
MMFTAAAISAGVLAAIIVAASATSRAAPTVALADVLRDDPKPEAIEYARTPAGPLHLYRFAPPGSATKARRAAVMWIHGGGWTAGSADAFFPHARYFASRGAVGFSLQYRLASPAGTGLAECVADCRAAVGFLRSHADELDIDPQKIVVLGDSAGGHLAAALALDIGREADADGATSAVPDAAVLYNPITDLTDPAWSRFAVGGAAIAKGAAPVTRPTDAQAAKARALSPVHGVRPKSPPVLVLHGTADHIVAVEQSRIFVAAMRSAGNDCTLEEFGGARHAFVVTRYTAPDELVVRAIRAADAWLAERRLLEGDPTLVVRP